MNKKRLLKLADFLETVPPEKFTLSTWQSNAPDKPEGEKEGSCGFAGCAVGWAVHAKLFDGLEFDVNGDAWDPAPVYAGERNWAAVGELFGLDYWGDTCLEGEKLFACYQYSGNPTPHVVAARIRKFVESNGVIP